ncbi:MAG: hypothetical protein RL367_714, partial [Pseudomonadota bacterium]
LSIINGGNSARQIGFAIEVSGIKPTEMICCDQPRTFDLAARAGRKVDVLPAALLADVLARTATLFA